MDVWGHDDQNPGTWNTHNRSPTFSESRQDPLDFWLNAVIMANVAYDTCIIAYMEWVKWLFSDLFFHLYEWNIA